jgi:phosphatidylinositol glycan class Z
LIDRSLADEFFQSQEITAGNLFNLQYFVPWEFDPTFPARSIIFPALSTGVWYNLFSLICNVSAWFLFVVPRLATFFYSLLLDLCAFHICTNLQIHHKGVLRTLATSWTMLVFHTRPFSNTFESVLVALTLALPATLSTDTRNVDASINRRAFLFGLLMAVGSFTRITYPGFAAPIGLYFLAAADFQRRKVGTRGNCFYQQCFNQFDHPVIFYFG